jgi:hypothetical protein
MVLVWLRRRALTNCARAADNRRRLSLSSLGLSAVLVVLTALPVSAHGNVNSAEVHAYQEDAGLSAETARTDLELQRRGTDIVEKLERSLGRGYAGVWFDPEAEQFVVPTASKGSGDAIAAAFARANLADDYRFRPVEYSWKELEATQHRIDKELANLFEERLVETSVDPRSNAVVVEVAASATPGDRAELAQIAADASGRVVVRDVGTSRYEGSRQSCAENLHNCSAPLRGGVEIGPHNAKMGTCTAAFLAISNTSLDRYLLSAGHCAAEKDPQNPILNWDAWDDQRAPLELGEAHYLGQVEQYAFPTHDWMKINVTDSWWKTGSSPSELAYWDKGYWEAEHDGGVDYEYAINGEVGSYPGQRVCQSGIATGGSCGNVMAVNVSYNFGEPGSTTYDLAKVEGMCGVEGDSGAPVFINHEAVGIHIGTDSSFGGCTSDVHVYYEEITDATAALGVHIAQPSIGSCASNGEGDDYAGPGPRATLRCNTEINVFYRDVNGNLGNYWWSPGGGWLSDPRAAAMASEPHPISRPNGEINVFYRDVNGNLGNYWWSPANGWVNDTRPAAMASDPHPVVRPNGEVNVFYRDVNGNLGNYWWSPATGWVSDSRPAAMASDPHAIVRPDGEINVFYRDVNGNLGNYWWSESGGWVSDTRAAAMASDPHPVVRPNGEVNVFYRDVNGNLGNYWWSPANGWVNDTRPAEMTSEPYALVRPSDGNLNVFYRKPDGNLGVFWWSPGGGWVNETRNAAIASRPPVVATGIATAVGPAEATVNATINPEGSLTNYYFEYGTTTGYGSRKPLVAKSAGNATSPSAVSERLNGLSPGVTYHYRIVATSPEGTTAGADATFTTPNPPGATTEPASMVAGTKAVLNASINPKGVATTYYFEYGTTTFYGTKTSSQNAGSGLEAGPVSQSVANLLPETTWHYRVVATNSEGTSRGIDRTFTTTPNVEAQLAGLAVTEAFDGGSASLSRFSSSWSALGWTAGKGEDTTSGWRPTAALPTANGAYYANSLTDPGSGVAAVATLNRAPAATEGYFSLWLDATPGTTRAGYELRFTETATNTYEVKLSKWVSGTRTVLASKMGYSLPEGRSVALVDRGSSVTAWVGVESAYNQLLSATDAAFSGGKVGIEGAGISSRLTSFKAATLPAKSSGPDGRWLLRNSNATGVADVEFIYGGPTLLPVVGDWNGDGIDTVGAYEQSTGKWFLRNSNTGGVGEIEFTYGGCCDLLPVVGDWNNDGVDTPGLYKPSTGEWYLRNSNTSGVGEINFIYGGGSGTLPIAGDWNNDGIDTIGIVAPEPEAADKWFLRNSNTSGIGNVNFTFGGGTGLVPLVGDWNNDGVDTPGLYKPSTAEWNLRNSNSTGVGEVNFVYGGGTSTKPVAGDWNKDGTDTVGVMR